MNFKIRILSLLLMLLMCASLFACNKNTDDPDTDSPGDDFSGTITKPGEEDGDDDDDSTENTEDAGDPDAVITITTADQLRAMKRRGTYILGSDIDLSGQAWTPVGTYAAPFEGTFDGKGHKITGLTIDKAAKDVGESLSYNYLYSGFFGVTDGATIKDTAFENVNISISTNEVYTINFTGAVAGLMRDTEISGCTVSGKIVSESSNSMANAGAIAGMTVGTKILSCSSVASISTKNSPARAVSGGLVGSARTGTKFENCFTKAEISADSTIGLAYAGGITGYCITTEMTLCYSDSTVYATVSHSDPENGAKGAAHAGGITAVATGTSDKTMSVFTKCSSTKATVKAYSIDNTTYASGISTDTDYTKFINCYSYAVLESQSLNDSAYASGLVGVVTEACAVENSFFAGSIKLDCPDNSFVTGTLSTSTFEAEAMTKIFKNASYKADTTFTINGVEYTKAMNKDIRTQGESRAANIFYSLSLLCDALGWDASEWEMVDGMIKHK